MRSSFFGVVGTFAFSLWAVSSTAGCGASSDGDTTAAGAGAGAAGSIDAAGGATGGGAGKAGGAPGNAGGAGGGGAGAAAGHAGVSGEAGASGGESGKGGSAGASGSAGGASGAAGSLGGASGSAGATQVGACGALPAPGTWDAASISPVVSTDPGAPDTFSGKSMAIVVDPFDSSTVWLGTGEKGLFKSPDCGATWTHVNTGTNGSALDQSSLWSMVVDPVNQGVIYTVAAYGAQGLWKSTNGGVDWVQLIVPGSAFELLINGINDFVNNVSMDATNPQHIVVMSHGSCASPYPLGCIAESVDGGSTWSNIVSMPAAWGEKGGVQVIDATTWIWGGGDGGSGMYVTTDNGKSWTHALPGGAGDSNGELSMQPLTPATNGAYYVSSLEGVVKSTDGVTWSLVWGQKNFMSAAVSGIAVSPANIYASEGQQFFSSPIGDDSNWSPMQGPAALTPDDSAEFLAYDVAHHLLYASTWGGGVFRIVTP